MTSENGFLTDVDKQFLRGEKEYASKQGRYDRRRAIRERTAAAFRDFALLYHDLPDEEYEKVLEAAYKTEGGEPDGRDGGEWLPMVVFQFMYRLMDGSAPGFGELLERAVFMAEMDQSGEYTSPSFEVNRSLPADDAKSIVVKVENGQVDKLTWEEMCLFINMYRRTEQFDPASVLEQSKLQCLSRGEWPIETSRPVDDAEDESQGRGWITNTELRAILRSDRFDADDIEHLREVLRANYDGESDGDQSSSDIDKLLGGEENAEE